MSAPDSAGLTGIVWRRIDPAHEFEVEALMRELMALSHRSAGFLGSEIFPPITGVQDAYVVLYRFSSAENLHGWLKSPARQEILRQIEPLLLQPAVEFFFAHRRREAGTVSTVFSYRIRLGCAEKFHEWRERIIDASRVFEGYIGIESFDTFDSANPEFIAVLRFDSRPHLDAWMQSPERAALIAEVHQYVEDYSIKRIGTGFEGWFEYGGDPGRPVAWRQGLVVLSALFPVIMALRALLHPVFNVLPFPVAFLLLLTIDVTILTYFIMPHFSRFMGFWLHPKNPRSWRRELAGWVILLGLIAVTLAANLCGGNTVAR